MKTNHEQTSCAQNPGEYHEIIHGVHLCVTFAEKENPEVLTRLRSLLLSACKEQLALAAHRG